VNPVEGFPESESFTDCAGVLRHFALEILHIPNHGYSAMAREVTDSEHRGYVFKAFAEGSAGLAFARLRAKVRQGIAQRFLIEEGPQKFEMPFERIRGRIDSEGVVVDGRLVRWDDFLALLSPYEGWEFDLRIPLEPDWEGELKP
jgi:hypothetical protein